MNVSNNSATNGNPFVFIVGIRLPGDWRRSARLVSRELQHELRKRVAAANARLFGEYNPWVNS